MRSEIACLSKGWTVTLLGRAASSQYCQGKCKSKAGMGILFLRRLVFAVFCADTSHSTALTQIFFVCHERMSIAGRNSSALEHGDVSVVHAVNVAFSKPLLPFDLCMINTGLFSL